MGKDNWIKYSFNRSYTNPYPEEGEMKVYLRPQGPSEIVPMDQAADNVARDIYSNYKNLYVAMSGGIDSEYVAKVLHRLNIPFTPIIFQLEDLNATDIWWAHKWCNENGYTPKVVSTTGEEFVKTMVMICKTYCTRAAGGPSAMYHMSKYVREQGGVLLTGAAFIEYFPDENLDYLLAENWRDSSVHDADGNVNKEGYIFHEPDLVNRFVVDDMPFNFLSWTPEIVLAYFAARDMTITSAENKARIFDCLPRPKLAVAAPNVFFRQFQPAWALMQLRKSGLGTTEIDYLGTKDELIELLKTGI
jgi:hypothetical protein